MTADTLAMILEAFRLTAVMGAGYNLILLAVNARRLHHTTPKMFAAITGIMALAVLFAGVPNVILSQVTFMTPETVLQRESAAFAWVLIAAVMALVSVAKAPRPQPVGVAYTMLILASLYAAALK
ncbi:MAG: hypothetical protein V4696_07430 [Pseudomonadota bacterium]